MPLPDTNAVRACLHAIELAIDNLEGLARSPREESIAEEARQAFKEIKQLLLTREGERAA